MPESAAPSTAYESATDPLGSSLALFACPACGGALSADSPAQLDCTNCGADYPLYDIAGTQVPWLMPDPDIAKLEWKARLNGFLERNRNEYDRVVNAAARNDSKDEYAGMRLKLLADALRSQCDAMLARLAPLGLDGIDFAAESSPALRLTHKLPAAQGLSSYMDNVFRDWAWDNGENEAQAAIIDTLLDHAGLKSIDRVLTLGAGAARLPYDLHRRWRPKQSVVVDFNPWLLLTGLITIAGEQPELDEIPLAPLSLSDTARRQTLRAPQPIDFVSDDSMRFVLADVTRPPFAAESSDVVVTPWLIDILSEDLTHFARRVNSLLRDGAVWVNSGSLAFMPEDPLRAYSVEEVLEVVADAGFDIIEWQRDTVPYLNSPLSAHHRTETLFSFVARKVTKVEPPAEHHVLPDWLIDLTLPIPVDAVDTLESSRFLLKAQVFGAADGVRSVAALGQQLAAHYGMAADEATHVVRRIFVEQVDRNHPSRIGGSL